MTVAPASVLAPLFEPIAINSLTLPNRIVMPAMHTMFAESDGAAGERLIAYHVERARGGVGLQIVENTCIEWNRGRANGAPTRVDEDVFIPGLHDLTAAVHRAGGRIATQLHHSGRQNTIANTVGRRGTVAPSPVACKVCLDVPAELTAAEIEGLIEAYAGAAARSQRAGFDLVEIHGAHGYLVQQFVSPYTNRRTDAWGGSRENRFRFPLEIARRAREAVGPDFPLTYRMSAEDGVPGGLSLDDSLVLAEALEEAGIDALHVSTGIYESMDRMFMMHGTPPGGLLPLAEAVRGRVGIPVIGVGRLGHDPEVAARAVADGKVDLVAFGRALIAEPRLPALLREDERDRVRPCLACNECVGALFNQWRAHCVVNPEYGHERERPGPALPAGRRVLVAGGGPAGMESATRLALRGFDVTLVEASDRLGGALAAATVPDHKRPEYDRLLAFLTSRLEEAGVSVRLATEASADIVAAERPEVVVVATGGVPAGLLVEGGDLPHVVGVAELLRDGQPPPAERAVIVGGTQPGLDCALWLRGLGLDVTVLERGDEPALDVNPILRGYLLGLAEAAGVAVRPGCTVTAVSPDNVSVAGPGGPDVLDAGLVVVAEAAGADPTAAAFVPAGVHLEVIGAAAVPDGRLLDATQTAFDVAGRL